MVIAAVGLLVTLGEGIVSRRRMYAGLVATGVPRATLGRSIVWQVIAPIVPAIVLALAVGYSLIRGVSGADEAAGTSQVCDERGCRTTTIEFVIPFGDLASSARSRSPPCSRSSAPACCCCAPVRRSKS